jgi:tetratricopeptide (TPR) repeat protein
MVRNAANRCRNAAGRTATVVACWCALCALAQSSPAESAALDAAQLQQAIDALVVDQRWADALAPARQLVELRAAEANGESPGLAPALSRLGDLERRAGELEAAGVSYSRAIRIGEATYGAVDARLIAPLRGLGLVYAALGDHERATAVLERAVQIVRRNLGVFDPQQIDLVEQITASEMQLGSLESAEDNIRYLLRLAAATYGEDDPRVAEPLNVLAYGYSRRGDYRIARDLYLRAIAWIQTKGGPDNPAFIQPLRGLADTQMRAFREGEPARIGAHREAISRNPLGTRFAPLTYVDTRPGIRRNLTAEGEAALERAIALMEMHADATSTADLVAALLQAGDWYLAKGDDGAARQRYARVWSITHDEDPAWMADGLDRSAMPLAAPVPVFVPPVVVRGAYRDPRSGESSPQQVTVRFTVNTDGGLGALEVIDSTAGSRATRSAVDALERAIYRPRYDDGRPVATTGVEYRVTGHW